MNLEQLSIDVADLCTEFIAVRNDITNACKLLQEISKNLQEINGGIQKLFNPIVTFSPDNLILPLEGETTPGSVIKAKPCDVVYAQQNDKALKLTLEDIINSMDPESKVALLEKLNKGENPDETDSKDNNRGDWLQE